MECQKVSHIKDKLVEMTHLNETIFAAGLASSHQGHKMKSGVYLNEDMLAQVCKHNVTRLPYEISQTCTRHCRWTSSNSSF